MGTLYESIYFLVVSVFVLNFGVAEIVYLINWGESKIIAPIVGSAFAFLLLKITNLHFFWPIIILSCILTAVLSIFLIGYLSDIIFEKLDNIFKKH